MSGLSRDGKTTAMISFWAGAVVAAVVLVAGVDAAEQADINVSKTTNMSIVSFFIITFLLQVNFDIE